MNRTLRGAFARRGPLLALAAMSAVVVAGAVTVLGFAARAGTGAMLTAPVLVLGVAAIPAAGRELGSARREEIGVARLRGLHGPDLVRYLAAEPALAIGAGAVAGQLVGLVGTWAATSHWLAEGTWWAGWPPTLAALAIALVALAAVLVGMGSAIREPLTQQVSVAERPHASTAWGLFGSLFVLVVAVTAGYRAWVAGPGDPDWVVLTAPALVGLGAGQLAVWTLEAFARGATRAGRGRGMATYLALRRLRGSAGLAHPLRLLVAGTVVAVVALSGATQVARWSDATARLQGGAPVRVPFAGGAASALQVTRTLDPEGRWLMAGASVLGGGSDHERRAYLDTSRYDAVLGDFLSGTPGAPLAELLPRLRSDRPGDADGVVIARGDTLVAEATGAGAWGMVQVEVSYVNDDGFLTSAVPLLGPSEGAAATAAALPDCVRACVATRVGVRRVGGGATVLITRLQLGDTDLLAQPWVAEGRGVGRTAAGLEVAPGAEATLAPPATVLPVVATADVAWPGRDRQVKTPGGVVRPARQVGRVPALPFTERVGVLVDLPRALAGDSPTVPVSEVVVLARADTPAALLQDLSAAAGASPVSLAEVRDSVVAETGAQQARAYALMALVCLAIAGLALAASASRRHSARVRELAVLRLLGVPATQAKRSAWVESGLLVAASVATAVATGLVAARLLLPALPLVRADEYAVPLATDVPLWVPLLVGGLAAAMLLAMGARLRLVPDAATRPATLREELGG